MYESGSLELSGLSHWLGSLSKENSFEYDFIILHPSASKLLPWQRWYMDSEPDMGFQVWVNLQVKKKMVPIINTVSTFLFLIVLGQQSYGFPSWPSGEEPTCQCRRHRRHSWFYSWVRKIPWRRERLPTLVSWPGECHRLYSPWGPKESDMPEWCALSLFSLLFQEHLLQARGPRAGAQPSRSAKSW